jgi:peptide chain release factor 2
MIKPGFWENQKEATKVVSELKGLKSTLSPWQQVKARYQELKEISQIIKDTDKDLGQELNAGLEDLLKQLAHLEFQALLNERFDRNNAILSINAGAGGTEACDWAQMLFRMYSRWAQSYKGYKVKTLDALFGEESGIKNITFLIEGDYAYGFLKSERGVHRLVRISPFDANKRRHTSFASVDVIPEVEEDMDIRIEEKDLRIETFRSSGPGGQHMQMTDSAVRITHIPSGLVAQCQNDRSQYKNKQAALKILKSRLYEMERKKKEQQLQKQFAGAKQKIEWGSQIRSYIMHPYTMVKDHRSNYESGNVGAVLDGDLDAFIEAYLKRAKSKD